MVDRDQLQLVDELSLLELVRDLDAIAAVDQPRVIQPVPGRALRGLENRAAEYLTLEPVALAVEAVDEGARVLRMIRFGGRRLAAIVGQRDDDDDRVDRQPAKKADHLPFSLADAELGDLFDADASRVVDRHVRSHRHLPFVDQPAQRRTVDAAPVGIGEGVKAFEGQGRHVGPIREVERDRTQLKSQVLAFRPVAGCVDDGGADPEPRQVDGVVGDPPQGDARLVVAPPVLGVGNRAQACELPLHHVTVGERQLDLLPGLDRLDLPTGYLVSRFLVDDGADPQTDEAATCGHQAGSNQ